MRIDCTQLVRAYSHLRIIPSALSDERHSNADIGARAAPPSLAPRGLRALAASVVLAAFGLVVL